MKKILVVDDELDVCDFIKHFFEDRHFEVVTTMDGEDAVKIAKKHKFDLILLDIRMKKMDGIEALRRIRDFDKNVKVIMVTAVEDQDKMDEACALGVCNYITKPLILEELENLVCEVTRKPKQ